MNAEINLAPTASLLAIEGHRREAGKSFEIAARTWGTAAESSAGALLLHGLGGHSAWFEAFASRLKAQGIFALAYDQLGFGKRRQEKFLSYEQWLDDLQIAYEYQKKLLPDKPLFILANSMGAAVALKAVASARIHPAGLAMFSPGMDGHPRTFSLPYRIRALLTAWTQPDSEIALPYTVELVTRQESVQKWLLHDPERRFAVPARMLWELLKMTSNLHQEARRIHCPAFMCEAGIDQLVDRAANERMWKQLGSAEKKQRLFAEAWHDLMFDPVLDEVVAEITNWIRTTGKTKSPVVS